MQTELKRTKRKSSAKSAKTSTKASSKTTSKASAKASIKTSTKPSVKVTATPVEIASRTLLKQLGSNKEEERDDAVRLVKQMLKTKRQLELTELTKLWKGLWYAMWHSDTPLVQQGLAQELADLVHEISTKNVWLFVSAFYTVCALEWPTLDRYRINKFYMLVRLVLRAQLERLQRKNWRSEEIAKFADLLLEEENGPLSYANAKTSHSLRLHLIDIFVDELAGVLEKGGKQPSVSELKQLLDPVISQTTKSDFTFIGDRVKEDVLKDERLVEWGIVEDSKPAAESSSDSDWDGFD